MAKKDKRIRYQSDAEKPVMVSVRLPRELYDRLERYATQYRQPISELVKDGIEMRLEVEADPRSRQAGSTTDEAMQATLARHDTQMQAIMLAIEHLQTTPPRLVNTGITVIKHVRESQQQAQSTGEEPARDTAAVDTTSAVQPNVLQEAQNPALAKGEVPSFDPAKHRLGKLCPSKDEWGTTGQSLRNADNQCLACKARAKREKAARQRERAARQEEKWHTQPVQG